MEIVTLRNTSKNGEPLEAVYIPEAGMGLISYKKGETEVFDQSTKPLFDKRRAGLGPMIGPHFFKRNPKIIPPVKDESLFPHIEKVKEHGGEDPFTHGIGRYAPWKFESTVNRIEAHLAGNDTWQGIKLSDLEGQNFKMTYAATLAQNGLHIEISCVSDTDSIVGVHYYYALPSGTGTVAASVQDTCIPFHRELTKIPKEWFEKDHKLRYTLDKDTDHTFRPYPDELNTEILLDTGAYKLVTRYTCSSAENSWQLWHPKGASFVCIEPLSAKDPMHPNLTVSSLKIQLEIL